MPERGTEDARRIAELIPNGLLRTGQSHHPVVLQGSNGAHRECPITSRWVHLVRKGCGPTYQRECDERGIAFVPFSPLGWPRSQHNDILTNSVVTSIARHHGATTAQVVLAWLLALAPNV
jgi:hypothetical protein